jgi:xylulokinase
MHLGIDLGTPGVKTVLTGADGASLAKTTAPLAVSALHPLWSEQDPAALVARRRGGAAAAGHRV